jgi:hypothetical protein
VVDMVKDNDQMKDNTTRGGFCQFLRHRSIPFISTMTTLYHTIPKDQQENKKKDAESTVIQIVVLCNGE